MMSHESLVSHAREATLDEGARAEELHDTLRQLILEVVEEEIHRGVSSLPLQRTQPLHLARQALPAAAVIEEDEDIDLVPPQPGTLTFLRLFTLDQENIMDYIIWEDHHTLSSQCHIDLLLYSWAKFLFYTDPTSHTYTCN
jgi:hypothetical protein